MATVTLKGDKIHTSGDLPKKGEKAPDFKLTTTDLQTKSLKDYEGQNLILNIFPSIDTKVCALSVRQFNRQATKLDDTKVLCVSRDLPFAMKRFIGNDNVEDVVSLSDYKDGNFGKAYGVEFVDGPFETLLSRCVVVIDKERKVVYTEQVSEIDDEPNYDAAINSLSLSFQ
ncbi:MAG TPA: thiol peroxidase [Aquaticitalea sp.]|nr:thiol peroxidase [Aquaticitalea sp.]